ncbi:phosphorylase family protein [Sorangium sp. So ce388]|uniref:5'-methylthioadenosine/S-adenosylhomocysteine nucleosidase family protein n=1 Tax=Sorangium sp. So ce388 TaxID=3133309 RepID=UPI003F5CA6CA
MTNGPLIDALRKLLPAQFELLVEKLDVPPEYLPSVQAPLATRAIDVLRYMHAQGRLADVERVLAEVTGRTKPSETLAPARAEAPGHAEARPRAAVPVDFLILTALPEERDAVLSKLPGHRRLDRDGVDLHTYFEATVATNREDGAIYRVLITCQASMGPIQAAISASAVTERWHPDHLLLVGIAGGLKAEVAFGDVMVARAVADYTVGKVREDGSREERWESYPADAGLVHAVNAFLVGWEDLISEARPEDGKPKRIVDVIASGGDVITSKELIAAYQKDWPKLIGVEMEGGAVAAALHHHKLRPRFIMIRGVSDLADGEDNASMKKVWRAYARDVAAAYAIGLLRDGPVPAKRCSEGQRNVLTHSDG